MELDDLRKQLYKKDSTLEDRPKPPAEFDLGRASLQQVPVQEGPKWTEEAPEKPFALTIVQRRWAIFGAVVFGIAVITAGVGLYLRWAGSFDKGGVALDIFGPERVLSGEEVNYVVRIKNNTRVALQSTELEFLLPAGSILPDGREISKQGDFSLVSKAVGDIAAGQELQETFKIRVLGDKDSQQKFSAKLSYKPSNSSMEFLNEKDFFSTIISVPLVLSFTLPEKIVSGQTLNFSLRYVNTSDATFSDTKLKIEYPAGFVFASALPSPSEDNNTWDLSEIGSGQEGRIIIKGTISGNEGESKVFKAQIGMMQSGEFVSFAQTLNSPKVSVSPLAIEQEITGLVDGQISLGQTLTYKLKYRNTTDVAIGPVVITSKIDSQAVDFGSLRVSGGFFSSSESMIIWNSSSLPKLESLAAGAEGELIFYLKIKEKLPIEDSADKNFTVTTLAQIDSPNVPLSLTGTSLMGKNQLIVKIDSRLVLSMKGYYQDSLLPNSGPLPPRVGQETTYTIYWQLINVSNDLIDVVVESSLPPYIRWKENVYPKNEDISYDETTSKVTWRISRLAAGTGLGLFLPVKQVVFQVGFMPSLSQAGSAAVIIKETQASGKDSFTEKNISVSVAELKSNMPDDPAVGYENSKVQN